MGKSRFGSRESVGGGKRNSSRLAKASYSDGSIRTMQNKYLRHLESDNLDSSSKGNLDALVYADTDILRLPKKRERKKGRLEDIRRLPMHITLLTAIQDAKYNAEKEKDNESEKEKPPQGNKDEEKEDTKKEETVVPPNFLNIVSQPSTQPRMKLCGMCGFEAAYSCSQCKAFYCSIPCRDTHTELRCMKWKV